MEFGKAPEDFTNKRWKEIEDRRSCLTENFYYFFEELYNILSHLKEPFNFKNKYRECFDNLGFCILNSQQYDEDLANAIYFLCLKFICNDDNNAEENEIIVQK